MTGGRFLAFSLEFYARPGVAAACVALQDEDGADVNFILFALWLASTGRALDPADFRELDRRVASWRAQIVAPLREIRRALRPPSPLSEIDRAGRLRQDVKAAELGAESLQQNLMEALGLGRESALDALALAAANLAAYEAYRRAALNRSEIGHLMGAFAAPDAVTPAAPECRQPNSPPPLPGA